MTKMTKIQVMFLLVAFAALIQFTTAAPHFDGHEGNDVVDEIIMKLKQLKQQGEGNEIVKVWNVLWKCSVMAMLISVVATIEMKNQNLKICSTIRIIERSPDVLQQSASG